MTPIVTNRLFEPGDALSVQEFLELWDQMPDLKQAELIEGRVYLPSPVSIEHGVRDSQLQMLLTNYATETGVCEVSSNATWLMLDNAPQPDIGLAVFPQFGGKANTRGRLASGAPELIVEISYSSRSLDAGPKSALYQRAGVEEYVLVQLHEQRVEWRFLQEGAYRKLRPEFGGIWKSIRFPGLWLNEPALWARDNRALKATLQQGLDSAECRKFITGFP